MTTNKSQEMGMRTDGRLRKMRLIDGLAPEMATEFLRPLGLRRYAKGEVLVHEGMAAKWVVVVISGVVNVYETGASGSRHLIRTVGEDGLIGATLVAKRFESYPCMAVATKECEVTFIEMARIRAVSTDVRYRQLVENLQAIVSEYVHYCWRKMAILACAKTEERFLLYLNWLADEVGSDEFTVPFARLEDCATYLGVTRASLSAAISHLVQRGVIAHPGRGRFALRIGREALRA